MKSNAVATANQFTKENVPNLLEAASALLEKHVSEDQRFSNDISKFVDIIGIK